MERKPHRGFLTHSLEVKCNKCGMEYGDHRAKAPHTLHMIVKNKVVKCPGFVSVKKSFFAPIQGLAPLNGCKDICRHMYCDLLRRAEGENLPN